MEHLSTIIVAVILGVILAAIVIREVKNRKSGKACSCGGNCGSCGICPSRDEQ